MQLDLSGKVVLVTGAARGIGAAIADAFCAEGCTVVRLDLASDGFPADPEHDLVCDVRDGEATRAVAADVERRFGRIDVLVNNAGILADGLLESMDDDAWDRSFDVNVGGVFRMCKAVIPAMKRQRSGRIINAASFAAIVPSVGSGAYAASKAAVVQLTRVLASELGPYGITANAYAPGMVPTAMNGFAEMPQAASSMVSIGLSARIPALLTSTSIRPKRRSISSAVLLAASPSPTSQTRSTSGSAGNPSLARSSRTTRHPSPRNVSAIAAPMPRAAPVTTTTLPCRSSSIASSSAGRSILSGHRGAVSGRCGWPRRDGSSG